MLKGGGENNSHNRVHRLARKLSKIKLVTVILNYNFVVTKLLVIYKAI